ncbi:MAG: VTT domain-containing protein, partial [Burkholderiales bacterium]
MSRTRLALLLLIVLMIAVFFALGWDRYLQLAYFKTQQAEIDEIFRLHPVATGAAFFAVYVAVTGLSLPGAALLTLAAGAIFGLGWGTLIVSFASSIGATLAFLVSRFLFRESIQSRFGDKLRAINAGVDKEGALYLLALRLVPAFPFFVINLVMGLTPIRTWSFYWVSQLGMLAGTLVYVNAGTQIARIDSLSGLLSPGLLVSLALLGVFPLLAKKILDWVKARKVYASWPRPARFDRNLVVIGAGAAGLVSAYIAAAVKAKVTLIEKHRMGGDCLNTGCVPSKALLRTAKLLAQAKNAKNYGIRSMRAEFDFAEVMQRVLRVIQEVEPHDSAKRYQSLGVECLAGEATIISPWAVKVRAASGEETILTTRAIVIAAGARPLLPPIPGLVEAGCLTS